MVIVVFIIVVIVMSIPARRGKARSDRQVLVSIMSINTSIMIISITHIIIPYVLYHVRYYVLVLLPLVVFMLGIMIWWYYGCSS